MRSRSGAVARSVASAALRQSSAHSTQHADSSVFPSVPAAHLAVRLHSPHSLSSRGRCVCARLFAIQRIHAQHNAPHTRIQMLSHATHPPTPTRPNIHTSTLARKSKLPLPPPTLSVTHSHITKSGVRLRRCGVEGGSKEDALDECGEGDLTEAQQLHQHPPLLPTPLSILRCLRA
jgi:hypothetical protein